MKLVFLNEQHSLLPVQIQLLDGKLGKAWRLEQVPASGWTIEETVDVYRRLRNDLDAVVFASPLPLLLALFSMLDGAAYGTPNPVVTWLFVKERRAHNERRVEDGREVVVLESRLEQEWKLLRIDDVWGATYEPCHQDTREREEKGEADG